MLPGAVNCKKAIHKLSSPPEDPEQQSASKIRRPEKSANADKKVSNNDKKRALLPLAK